MERIENTSALKTCLIDANPNALMIIDFKGNVLEVNQKLLSLFDCKKNSLRNANLNDFFDETDFLKKHREIFLKKNQSEIHSFLKLKNQTIAIVLISLPFKNEMGKVAGAVIQFKNPAIVDSNYIFNPEEKIGGKLKNQSSDLSSQEISSRYARSLIEASLDPLFTISVEGKITDFNNASIEVTGLKREKLINSDFKTYFTEPEEAQKVYQQIFEKGFIDAYPLVIKDHKLTAVLLNGSVYKNDKGLVIGAVVVARDITTQNKIEKELIEAKEFAEKATQIAEFAKLKAESATQIAEEAVKSKQQFLSNMSHEIRTPMNAIIGFTKVVLKTELDEKQREYIEAIKISGDALIVLINDILDLAKVDSGKMVFERAPFKMAFSIAAMLHLFEPKIQEKNLTLIRQYDEEIPQVLIGDPARLHQIILNLMSNAVKFTNRGKITISVDLISESKKDVTIEFAIADTGIGIAENKITSIFENFQQATSGTSRIYGGTGLGLAIVKKLIESQGGCIQVKSELGKGSTFSFRLKFQKTSESVENILPFFPKDDQIKGVKILVVEDIALNQLLMKTLLDDFGFNSEIAVNGKIAIEKVKKNNYDIILMDLQMPEMNGFDATKYIRNELKSKIPIIALTADVTTMDLAKCKLVGMNDYIAKPVDEQLLYSKIVGHLKNPTSTLMSNKSAILENKKRCINLNYLMTRTKSNPTLMVEMISLYLEQTPPLLSSMKESFASKDWKTLQSAVHKMIPSFSIMGIDNQIEEMAKSIKNFAEEQFQMNDIENMVYQIESVCLQAFDELNEELKLIQLN
jgi:PAS domain S-box-containing protein